MPAAAIRILIALLALTGQAAAVDHVSFRFHGDDAHLVGRLLVQGKDAESLLQTPDGVLWAIAAGDLVETRADDEPFAPLDGQELGRRILADLPAGFEVHRTAHYVICYDTSRAYAQWCGGLLERLYLAFGNYWSRQGFKLREPEFPLVAVIFADRAVYRDYARPELGDGAKAIVGYYSLRTNRVTMCDLTGVAGAAGASGAGASGTVAQINAALARADAQATVATVVHEATHQVAFNCGLHARYADIPLWLSEGLAVYFESPDLKSAKGWRTMGEVNRPRLAQFRAGLARRPADALRSLIQDDARLRDVATAPAAYAEAWALVHYLVRNRRDELNAYLRTMAAKPPLARDVPEVRVREFVEHFGDLGPLEADFLRQMGRVK